MAPVFHSDAEKCVDAVLSAVGHEIVLGLASGNGKPAHLAKAFFRRALPAAVARKACSSRPKP